MAEVARKDQKDTVDSPDGSGVCCASPSTQYTDKGSENVLCNGIGVVREGDSMITHNYDGPCCNPHSPVLSSYSTTVFINGKGVGRKGDMYGGNHMISSGSSNVFIGG